MRVWKGACPQGERLNGAPLGEDTVLIVNMRQSWKGLPGRNNQASSSCDEARGLVTLTLGVNIKVTLSETLIFGQNKL